MDTAPIFWPEKEDYDTAMKDMREKVRDPIIKYSKIEEDQTGTLRYGGANLYVTLYRVGDWMVRCFCRNDARRQTPPPDILTRYQYISTFANSNAQQVPALVPITYVDKAIEVDCLDRSGRSYVLIKTEVMPFVRMPFIFGLPLGGFIAGNYRDGILMEKLCAAWLQMIRDLEKVHMAHGDLDLTNIIVTQQASNIILKLIDYDNAWVPALGSGREQTEVGHEHFQHPAFQSRKKRPYDPYMDRFSALSIYISLKALRAYPQLYTHKEWGADDTHHLLLTRTDYEAEMEQSSTNHITLLRSAGISGLEPLLDELSLSLQQRRLPRSLNELLSNTARGWSPDVSPLPEPGKQPQSSPASNEEEIEYIYMDWEKAQYIKQKNEPLIPASPETTTVAGGQPAIDPWAPTPPVTDIFQFEPRPEPISPFFSEFEPRPGPMPPFEPRPEPISPFFPEFEPRPGPISPFSPVEQGRQRRRTKVGYVVAFAIILIIIIIALLWFANVIPHHIASSPQSWALSLAAIFSPLSGYNRLEPDNQAETNC